MTYTALPDRRMPYDNDGTVVYTTTDNQNSASFALHTPNLVLTQTQMQELQDTDQATVMAELSTGSDGSAALWWFFPEQREVTGAIFIHQGGPDSTAMGGSNDSTNGIDGTWETPSTPSGSPFQNYSAVDQWRNAIRPISFTGPKRNFRAILALNSSGAANATWYLAHVYGEKGAGQTPDDVIYIDHDTTPGVEYASPEDFGDQPLGTTVVRQFRLKNTSATKTANAIDVQCNDSDFAISTDGVTWVVTINIASLGPGAQSATMYVRCTTPAPGNLLGPRFGRIVTTVASYT